MKRRTWPISSFSPVSAPSDSLKWATCTVHSKCWFLPYPQNGRWGVCRVAGCSAPHQALVLWSMPPSGPCQPPPTLIWVSNIQPHVCTHVNTHCAHFLAPSACRPGAGRCWLTGPVMYRLHLNSAHLESHKAKVITILLQRTLHRRGGQRRSAKCVPDKKYICSCFEFHIKKHAKKRAGRRAPSLIRHLNEGREIRFPKRSDTHTHLLYFIYILICMYTFKHTQKPTVIIYQTITQYCYKASAQSFTLFLHLISLLTNAEVCSTVTKSSVTITFFLTGAEFVPKPTLPFPSFTD